MILFLFIYLAICIDDPIHSAILYGNSTQGYYYVNLYIGENRQKQSVIVDTGSSITAFPCVDCKYCGNHEDQYYDYEVTTFMIKKSQFSQDVGCEEQIGEAKCRSCDSQKCVFHISYAEGSSLSGHFIQDVMLLGDEFQDIKDEGEVNQIIKQEVAIGVFGCITQMNNMFLTQRANGIMGLSPKTNSYDQFPNYIDILYNKEHEIGIKKMFTLCLGRQNGYMSVGQYDQSRHSNESEYHKVKYYRDRGDQYRVIIKNISINGQIVATQGVIDSGQGAFLDSGSTLMNTHQELYDLLTKQFNCQNESCPPKMYVEGMHCYQYSKTNHGSFSNFVTFFPTFTFSMENNFTLQWKPINYLTLTMNSEDIYCFPVYAIPGQNRLILGQVWMRNWDIAFDRQAEELTFVEANCSFTKVMHNFTEEEIMKIESTSEKLHYARRQYNDQIERKTTSKLLIFSLLSLIIIGSIFYGFYRYMLCMKRRNKYNVIELRDM